MPLNVCADLAETFSIIHRLHADICSLFSFVKLCNATHTSNLLLFKVIQISDKWKRE